MKIPEKIKRSQANTNQIIGEQIKERRLSLGLSQAVVARQLGVSYQQLQKYETGVNQISSCSLFSLTEILDVPIGYFYQEIKRLNGLDPQKNGRTNNPPRPSESDLTRGEIREFLKAYQGIKNPGLRQKIKDLIITISRLSEPPSANSAPDKQ